MKTVEAGRMPVPRKRLLFVCDLRLMLPGIGRDAIYGLLRSGEIPNRLIAGRRATTPEAVDRWLNSIGQSEHESGCDELTGATS